MDCCICLTKPAVWGWGVEEAVLAIQSGTAAAAAACPLTTRKTLTGMGRCQEVKRGENVMAKATKKPVKSPETHRDLSVLASPGEPSPLPLRAPQSPAPSCQKQGSHLSNRWLRSGPEAFLFKKNKSLLLVSETESGRESHGKEAVSFLKSLTFWDLARVLKCLSCSALPFAHDLRARIRDKPLTCLPTTLAGSDPSNPSLGLTFLTMPGWIFWIHQNPQCSPQLLTRALHS